MRSASFAQAPAPEDQGAYCSPRPFPLLCLLALPSWTLLSDLDSGSLVNPPKLDHRIPRRSTSIRKQTHAGAHAGLTTPFIIINTEKCRPRSTNGKRVAIPAQGRRLRRRQGGCQGTLPRA